KYGMPEGGREGSLVIASFNIRKLSTYKGRKAELEFMARFCAACDLVSIQEVQDNLDGLRFLKERTESRVAGQGEYSFTTSDITGKAPGGKGMAERLAFLYRHHRIRRLDMTSDLTFDRSAVFNRLFDDEKIWAEAREAFAKKMARFKAGDLKTKPSFTPPEFLTFVRTPYVTAFEAPAANDQPSLTFTSVAAHLVYGKPVERKQEFEALFDWLANRLTAKDRLVTPNFILMGDLNLNFDDPKADRKPIDKLIKAGNADIFGDPDAQRIYFPFIDKHPDFKKVFTTNARANQTFDQIAFFLGAEEKRLPNHTWHGDIKKRGPDDFDYGVFDFAELFAQALLGKSYLRLNKTEKKKLGKKFEHSVSDHLPIWVRLPRPGFAP
ncbi:MAG: endonuclease/exonuclease/phosphatase family protein, partial [Sphingomonadales bacterium]